MTLEELLNELVYTINSVIEDGHKPKDIDVRIQLDGEKGSVCSNEHIKIEYDNFGCMSGCVINGAIDEE